MSGGSDTVMWKRLRMHKPPILPALLLYVGATVGLLFLLFLFFQSQGLSWGNFGIALAFFVPAIAAVGYLLLSEAHSSKARQDARLEHLTREILHEINLPIATIHSNLQMLSARIENPHNRKRIERSEAALARLRRLYDELDYRIRREFHAIEAEPFDLAEMVRERVGVHEEMGRNPFVLQLEPCRVVLDRIGMEQVLDNVIENAMKYSEASQPIDLSLYEGRLTIRDRGIGMDGAQIARIYERYYQGDTHNPGEGIGLALVKRYCDEMGIGIRIDSTPGEGTYVTFDLHKVIQK